MASAPSICPACGGRFPEHEPACPHRAAPGDADALLGAVLSGMYRVVRPLGEGGMGKVYEVHHTRIPGKRFALKALHPEFADHASVLARFRREAEAAASIQSPHVVEVVDVNQAADGRLFIVAEYLDGQDLGAHLNAVGKMPVAAAVRVVRQVCKGLAAAHDKGVVHRDVKPDNIFLVGDAARPTAKVLDFGISKTAERSELTQTGMVMGTPYFMAPEQARGDRVDHRADIYAIGAVLYRALTGQPPFDRDSPTATLVAVLTEAPPPPRSLNPDIPAELELIIQRAMAKEPADRYASVAALDRELAPYDEEPSPSARPVSIDAFGRLSMLGPSASTTTDAYMTRQLLLLFSLLGAAWLGAGVVSAAAGLVRTSRGDGAALSLTSAAFLALGASCALGAALLAGAWHVRRRVWPDDAKVRALVQAIGQPVLLGVGSYGFASLLVRLMESVLFQRAVGIAWPAWDALLFSVSLAVAGGVRLYAREQGRA